jgi:hypothetical protein
MARRRRARAVARFLQSLFRRPAMLSLRCVSCRWPYCVIRGMKGRHPGGAMVVGGAWAGRSSRRAVAVSQPRKKLPRAKKTCAPEKKPSPVSEARSLDENRGYFA